VYKTEAKNKITQRTFYQQEDCW